MAIRPLAFSVRLRDPEKGRTLRIQNDPSDPDRYLLKDERPNEPVRTQSFENAPSAVKDAATRWRKRLH